MAHRPLPEALGSAFTVRRAAQLGVGYGRTRGADLHAPFHGVRAAKNAPAPTTREERLAHAAALYAPRLLPGQFFCGPTALALHGLPVPAAIDPAKVHVAVVAPRTPPRARGVAGHRYGALTPVTSSRGPAVEAWCQSAVSATVDDLVVIGDALVRRVAPFATMDILSSAVARWRGKRGARALARALPLIRPRTDSPAETRVRLVIVRAGLEEPVVNFAIRDPEGRFLGFGDLAYPREKVVIEYEGRHHFEERQAYLDIDRLAAFVAAGWLVVRLHKYHLRDPRSLAQKVRGALASRRTPARGAELLA